MNPVSRWHLVQEIVFAASALRGEERSAYLSEHCPDSALRREVERLLNGGAAEDRTGNASAGPGMATKPGGQGLAPGTRLGHYQIGKKLGAGGMGWVYEAADEKLRRTVAIKVLPPGEIDEDLRRRFTREAQSASALNHPNIITVYEVGREGDVDFIVMERVDGETLHQKIGGKGLDTRSTLRLAIQIGDALATAHDAGIVHRDLKPGNVMVTERGLVKVLDFGLAKHTHRMRAADPDAPTLEPLSQLGQVVGTMAYMSPEQAAGRPVDTRSDIFSFGSVLFEMMTGRRAFRDSGMGTLAAIVQTEPPLAELPASLPRGLERILTKCLAKHPADRWQHISDVKLQIEDLLKDLDSPPAPEPEAAPARRRFGWLLVTAATLAGALVGAVLFYVFSGASPATLSEPVLRMVTADTGLSSFPALSRDGKLLAFASDRGKEGSLDIWLQQIGGRELIRLTTDPADESDPTFSPDGTRIAFRSEKDGGGIYVMPTLGGEAPALVAPGGRNPRFSPEGKWIAYWTGREGGFYPGSSHLFLVEPGGGPPRPVHPEMPAALFPIWSPRGDALLVLGQVGGVQDWFLVPLDPNSPVRKTGALAELKKEGLSQFQRGLAIRQAALDWTDQGGDHVLFATSLGDAANLWEIDLGSKGVVRGPARRLTRGPGRQVLASRAATGDVETTAFADEELNYDIWAMPVDADSGVPRGEPRRLTDEHSPEWAPSISSDGHKLAYVSRRGGNWLLRTRDLDSGKEITVISSPIQILNARLAGDASRVLYSNTEYNLFSVLRSGGAVEKLCDACGTVMGVSYDGKKAIYEPLANEDLLVFDAVGGKSGKLALRPKDDVILSAGQFSRDGKWVAFHSIHNPAAAVQVWVAPVLRDPAPQSEWIPITDGRAPDREPCWAPGGGLLYFLSERDGFRCIWAQRLDDRTKRPSGAALAVRHFHTARQRLGSVGYLTGLSVGGDQMVFALGELTGNVWLAENRRSK